MYGILEDIKLEKLWVAIMKSKDINHVGSIIPQWENKGVVYLGAKDDVIARAKVYIINRQRGDPFKYVEYDLFEEKLISFF